MDRRKHILVVDDNQAEAERLREYLTQNGFHVTVAFSAKEGFRSIVETVPDLILLGVHLPDMTGTELCSRLRNRPATHDVPIVLSTAKAVTVEEKLAGYGAGADDFLVHPFEPAEVLARITVLIRRSHSKLKSKVKVGSLVSDFPEAPTTAPEPPPAAVPVPAATPSVSVARPRLLDLVRRFFAALVSPSTAFVDVDPRRDMLVAVGSVVLTAVAASIPAITKPRADFDSWIGDFSVALVINLLLWLSTSGLLALVLPFTGTVLPSKVALCAAGLSWTPRAIGALLSALYGAGAKIVMSGDVRPFSAGIDILPGMPRAEWIESISHLSLFDVWAAWAILHAFWRYRPEGQKRRDGISIFVGVVCLLFGALTRY